MRTAPPLIALIEGRRERPRNASKTAPREIGLHMAVAGLLRRHVRPGWFWGYIPSGELRDKATAGKLKAMGAPRGWPDMLLLSPGGAMRCLELKRLGEDLTEEQEAFQLWCVRNGMPYCVARTMPEALLIFAEWGCLSDEAQGATGGAA